MLGIKKIFNLFFMLLLFHRHSAQELELVPPVGVNQFLGDSKLSPNGKLVATNGGNVLYIWDFRTQRLLRSFATKRVDISSFGFSSDSKYIYTVTTYSDYVDIWDIEAGRETATYRINGENFNANFTLHYNRLAIPLMDSICIWDFNGNKIKSFLQTDEGIVNVIFSNDNKRLVLFSNKGFLKIISADSGKEIYKSKIYDAKSYSFLNNLQLKESQDGSKVLVKGGDGKCLLFKRTPSRGYEPYKALNDINTFIDYNEKDQITLIKRKKKELMLHFSSKANPELLKGFKKFTILNASWKDSVLILLVKSDSTFPPEHRVVSLNFFSGKLISSLKIDVGFWALLSTSSNIGETYFLFQANGNVYLLNVDKRKIVAGFKNRVPLVKNIYFGRNDSTIITFTDDSELRIIDFYTGKIQRVFRINQYNDIVALSPNKQFLAAASIDSTVHYYDIASGELLKKFKGHKRPISSLDFSTDGKYLVSGSEDMSVRIWDVASSKTLDSITGFNDWPRHTSFSRDGSSLITYTSNGPLQVWSTVTKQLLFERNVCGGPSSVAMDDANKYIALAGGCGNGELIIYNLADGTEYFKFPYQPERINSIAFWNDGKTMLVASGDNSAKIWDITEQKLLSTFDDHKNEIITAVASNNGRYVITASEDRTIKIWNVNGQKPLYSYLIIDNLDYIIQLHTKYYMSSLNATKLLHYVTSDLRVITFEQLDVKYNRPDLVLDAISNSDTALISSYHKAYEKRIKKLRIDTTAFSAGFSIPECDFVNRDSIAYEQRDNILKLHIRGKDTSSLLDRFNIWVNEAPLFGAKGYSLRNKKTDQLDTTVTINLSNNTNVIETSITNVIGLESYRMPLQVSYTPAASQKQQKEKTYFIGIGVDKFQDNNYNLSWSVKDIRNLADSLKTKYKQDITIDTLFNEQMTVFNITELKKKLLQTTINDRVILAYSGHGLLSDSFDYYLSTYEVNFDKPEQNGLPYEALESLLDSIPARMKLMLLDACHSGEMDKEEMEHYRRVQAKLDKGIKGTILENKDSARLGMKSSFELMQELFVNVGRSTGATVISAAAGTQFALEKNNLKNGVFTYSILEYMQQHPTCTVSELKQYVNRRVSELTEGLQQPTARSENIQVDWKVW